jgi:hypothetical protein
MIMSVTSKDALNVHDACKEAVVDSLLNNLSARLAGRGSFFRSILGNRPSAILISEFIVPMPEGERDGDEEASPIQISAHGADFQVSFESESQPLTVDLRGSVYVRILPTSEDVSLNGPLEPTFPLKSEVRRELKRRIRESMKSLRIELKMTGRDSPRHPDWARRSEELRRTVHESLGIPFENALDRTNLEDESPADGDSPVDELDGAESDGPAEVEARARTLLPDNVVDPIRPPEKWLRLDLDLPSFTFTPASAASDSKKASDTLNASVREQLTSWVESDLPDIGGKRWGYRDARILPSNLEKWDQTLVDIRNSVAPIVVPELELRWIFSALEDPSDPGRLSVHVALENWSRVPGAGTRKQVDQSFFQVAISVHVPKVIHRPLRLDRVKPSYRYNEYLEYAALGFNGGVIVDEKEEELILATTWAPRYVLPRMDPVDRSSEGVCTKIAKLAEPDCLQGLDPLIAAYSAWIESVENNKATYSGRGLATGVHAAAELEKLNEDLKAWKAELRSIETGISILRESAAKWSGPGQQASGAGIPFEAWLSMNAAMSTLAESKGYGDWRLFQLAFILACIPAFATRIPEFHKFYTEDVAEQANAVTLLYFATGGGKSEAFLGLLVFVLFLDRLRGKHHGISALMRYPLRLLTLQQAQRTFRAMGAADAVRHQRGHSGEPFSLGFWVGSSNTPNWHSDEGYSSIPTVSAQPLETEMQFQAGAPYKNLKERWLKLDSCPFCQSDKPMALRRVSGAGGNTLGHFCTASRDECSWNERFSEPVPLPFYVVDEDIYDIAPSVLLGTVDKLSALGQSQGTIRKFFGMFGFAPFIEQDTDRLFVPRRASDWANEPGANLRPMFPTYQDGERRFFDPFPSLLIQDEAHLLDESLGTFAGLFESALEAGFDDLAPLLVDQVVTAPGSSDRRRIKVIAASATVNDPHRQMRNLYLRGTTIQFPYPGPHLYRSFYAQPRSPDGRVEDVLRRKFDQDDVELYSHWGRVYVSVLTNGHKHTVAMAAVLGHFHHLITGLYENFRSNESQKIEIARNELIRWISRDAHYEQFEIVLKKADAGTLLTLIDLHRIALTYVTNKKGGDQVIDTERMQFAKLHENTEHSGQRLLSELISGAVSASDIQRVVRMAEDRVRPGKQFPPLNETLRSVIATSAVSHGVDVEQFNSMFFAGMPSEIAEYIQASSRVGRTHVGFSLLVPVPQRYRDRFILEIHDVFHRFLERMILPAAIDRWAEKALVRVIPSFFQEYVCGISAIHELCTETSEHKRDCGLHESAAEARSFLTVTDNLRSTERFIMRALGLNVLPLPEGAPHYRSVVEREIEIYRKAMEVERLANSRLRQFFEAVDSRLRPMTSLRDVDEPGIIHESIFDASGSRKAPEGATARAMTFIRRGSGADIDDTVGRDEASD